MLQIDFKKTVFFMDGFMAKAEKVEDGIFRWLNALITFILFYVVCNLGRIFRF